MTPPSPFIHLPQPNLLSVFSGVVSRGLGDGSDPPPSPNLSLSQSNKTFDIFGMLMLEILFYISEPCRKGEK